MEIPAYPDSRGIDRSDKTVFDGLFREMQPRLSEFTFSGLYLFRQAHGYCLSLLGSSLIVSAKGYDGARYCLPPLGGDVFAALKQLAGDGVVLYGVDDHFAELYLAERMTDLVPDRDSFDYLYLRDALSVLPGNRFHKKRNRIAYFTARHDYEVCLFAPQYQVGCLELLEACGHGTGLAGASAPLELEAAGEAIQFAGDLELQGLVVLVDGVVRGFALGERLNDNTAVCHFEKADRFYEGVAQLLNREFSRLLFTDCLYLNREQDLGEPGLRNAKLSYHPLELVKKYRINLSLS